METLFLIPCENVNMETYEQATYLKAKVAVFSIHVLLVPVKMAYLKRKKKSSSFILADMKSMSMEHNYVKEKTMH